MRVTDLNKKELTVLFGLLKLTVLADRNVSPVEEEFLDEINLELGSKIYDGLTKEYKENFFEDEIVEIIGKLTDSEVSDHKDLKRILGGLMSRAFLRIYYKDYKEARKFKALLTEIQREEARKLIYELTFDASSTDSIDESEEEILNWIKQTWKLEV